MPDTPCIEWTKYRTWDGYGRVSVKGHLNLAHRVAWEKAHGPIPDGLQVLHRCDNPPCVNVDHLFLGTRFDNMQDAAAKGRFRSEARRKANRQKSTGRTGELNNNARLTADQADEIRRRYAAGGISMRALGAEFGIHNGTVSKIVRGLRYPARLDSLGGTE